MATSQYTIHLRPAAIEDAARIAEIWHEGWIDGHVGHVDDSLVTWRTAESFAQRAPRRLGDTTVAISDGELAGFVMVVDDEVEQVYVHTAFRGAGTADVLLDEAERRVAVAGFSAAWLAVVDGNARARSFYERRGWINAGNLDYRARKADGDVVVVPCSKYTKTLAN